MTPLTTEMEQPPATGRTLVGARGGPTPESRPAADDRRRRREPPLRVLIAGAGRMAQQHVRAIQRLADRAGIVAIADPDRSTLDHVLRLCPGVASYPSLAEALAATNADVVHICTPPATHEPLAAVALEAGCDVYVEKPFAETRCGAEHLVARAGTRDVRLCAGHQLLFESPARRALALLPALGDIVHVESYFSFRPVRRGPGGGPAMRPDLQLLDVLPHPVYLLLAFLHAARPSAPIELAARTLGPGGTVHALIRCGDLTGSLTLTLVGRPIETFVRASGSNGAVHADFVRGSVQRLIGPGSSGVDKVLNPYRLARQLFTGTTLALGGRFARQRRDYPGLVEIVGAFYDSVLSGGPPPIALEDIIETVSVCEEIARALPATVPSSGATPRPWSEGSREASTPTSPVGVPSAPLRRLAVAVTGGTGLLGAAVVRALGEKAARVVVLARRLPAPWERQPGVEYRSADLGEPLDPGALGGTDVVVHCDAATSGGWEDHQRNSLDATENLLRAAAAAGARRLLHVSSLAVVTSPDGKPIGDDAPLHADSRARGPYVWGKLESERLALELGPQLGLQVKVVRPGALIDYDSFDPPGRLGKRVGNLFVAVGSPADRLGTADVGFCADALAWMCEHFDEAPDAMNLLEPELPSKRLLLRHLRARNPDLRVFWLPRFIVAPASLLAVGLQRVLRPGRPPINAARVFAPEAYDTASSADLTQRLAHTGEGG